MVILQGTDDVVVNPKNANEIMEQWTGLHQIDRDSVSVQKQFQNNPKVTRSSWSEGKEQELVVLYEFDGLGHVLAVDVGNEKDQGGSDGLFSVDIDFHSTYWIAKEFGLIRE
jgi:poly(3-hydroxybutyrate) depolymerase